MTPSLERQKGRLLATAWFFLLCTAAAAASTNSDWSLRVWQSDEGLPNNTVTGLAQTADGYLWIATPTRLTRFDGNRFEVVSREVFAPGSSQRTSKLIRSRQGGLWLAMDHGPVIHARDGDIQYFSKNLPDEIVQTVDEDSTGALWVTYRGSAGVYRVFDGQVSRFTRTNGLPEWSFISLAEDHQHRLWFAKGGVVGIINDGRFDIRFPITNPTTGIRIAPAAAGGLWICAGTELFRLAEDGAPERVGTFQPDMRDAEPSVLHEDRNGGVWIGTTDSGLFHFDGTRFESVATSHRQILSLLEDSEGDIWVGTGGGGLNQLQPRAITLENAASGLPFESLRTISEDSAGAFWATTRNGLLVCRSNGTWKTISTNSNWPGGVATAVAADKEGNVWVGTQNSALYCLRDGEFSVWRPTNGFVSHTIHALLADDHGGVWIGGNAPESVQHLHDGRLDSIPLPHAVGMIRTFAADTNGGLWVGSTKGALLYIVSNQVVDVGRQVGSTNSIRSLCTTPDGSVWIGYAGWGLARIKDGNLSRITSGRGLYDDYISQIVPDGNGWLWFGADHGIFKIREQELNRAVENPSTRVQFVHYGRDEGLPSLQANFDESPNSLRSRDGRLWLPMSTALAVVEPRNFHEHSRSPPILLNRVLVDDSPVASYGGVMPASTAIDLKNPQAMIRLAPGHHRLELDFTAVSFSAPENILFQYRLKGFDDKWVEAGTQRNAIYSRLAAGPYQFQVRARDSGADWNNTTANLAFIVEPYFWQTWWFRFTSTGLFTVLLIAGVRYVSFRRLRSRVRALEQQAALDKERARIARDLHDHLGGTLTQMTLQLELALRSKARPEKTEAHVERGLEAARQVIKSLDETVWAVNPGNDTLPHVINYIGEYAVEFFQSAGIRCRLDLPERLPPQPVSAETRHNLFLAMKESFNNVVRHANASEVRLRADVTNGALKFWVEDNGHGFEHDSNRVSADGLRNMQKRMEDIGGTFKVESRGRDGTRLAFICPWQDGN